MREFFDVALIGGGAAPAFPSAFLPPFLLLTSFR